MTIKDSENVIWQSVLYLPEHAALLKNIKKDYYRRTKPELEEYQIRKIENQLNVAMEHSFITKFTAWEDGYDWEYIGRVKRLDPISKMIDLEVNQEDGYIMKIKFEDVIRIEVQG